MSLLKWNQDEEDRQKEDLLNEPSVKSIQSVQSGSWQPTQNNATETTDQPQRTNYLVSDEKAQLDDIQRQKREAEAEAARQAEAQRVANEAIAVRENEAKAKVTTKYTNPEQKDEGFWGFLKGVGSSIQQGLGSVADVAGQAGATLSYLNPLQSEETRNKNILDYDKSRREVLKNNKDIMGNSFIGTTDVEQQAGDIAAGRGDIQDFASVAGKGLQTGIDATMFLNPARLALKGAPAILTPTINTAAKIFKSPIVKYAARDAAFFGSLQGTATFQTVYGQTGDFEQAIEAAAKDAIIGGTLQGTLDVAGTGIHAVANRTINSLRRPGRFDIEGGSQLTPVPQERGATISENSVPTDANVSFENKTPVVGTPAPAFAPVAKNLTVTPVNTPVETGLNPTIDQNPNVAKATDTPIEPIGEVTSAVTDKAPVVADGIPQPRQAIPAVDNSKMPVVKSEEIRQLQDARAGTSQADEAIINQKLQRIKSETPQVTKAVDDTLTDARAPKESDIADNAQIKDLDLSLENIGQRRAQLIADGRSENHSSVKQLDKAADAIIHEQEKIAEGIRSGEVMADKGTIPEWERQRNKALAKTEEVVGVLETGRKYGGKIGTSFAPGYKQNVEALRNASPNKAYEIDPKTGKTREHESSEILSAFSRSVGEDLPPIIIGNTPKPGAGKRLDNNTAGANATYSSSFSRLDYKEKRSVYHETVHHIDRFIEDYKGENPKVLELQKLRKEITPEEVRKYKKVDSSADNAYEYVAHAMDIILDGRLKKGELGAGVLKYVKAFFAQVKEALTSAHIYGRQGIDTVKYVKELDKAIHEIDIQKLPKQKPLSPEDLTPTSNLPTTMIPVKTPTVPKAKKVLTPEQKTINDFAKRVFSNTDLHKDFVRRLARALGLEKDTESSVAELLSKTSVKVGTKDRGIIESKFVELEKITEEFNSIMKQQRKGYQNGKISGLDEAASKRANQLIDSYGRIERDLNGYVRKINGKRSIGNRVANAVENITGSRNASILTSVGGVSRNVTQELGANILETVLHPVRMARGVVNMPAEIARAYRRTAREFTVKPKTVSEVFPYLIGNSYRFIMSPVTGIANVRKGVARDTLAESLLRAQGENPTRAEIKKFAGAMGADSEVAANNLMGIMNGMTSHGKGLEVMRAYQEFIKTGSTAAKEKFLANTEKASNLAAKMSQEASKSDNPRIRIQVALMNTVLPFVNTATNLGKTAVTYNLNPLSRSINDEVLKAVRSNPANVMAILKNKAATYGVLGGVFALYQAGTIGYNDGEEVDKPTGIYIDMGDGNFHAVRATPIEIPIAAVVTAAEIARDAAEGKMRPTNYYLGIIGNSLPYVDGTTNAAAAIVSAVNSYLGGDGTNGTNDNGYAAKAYAVNMAKSFVPYSNNGVIPAINQAQGKSTNAKTVYDKDMGKWFGQAVRSSFDPAFRDTLKDSRDASGRVRTVDQQGLTGIKKTINDADTAKFNDRVIDLVKYGRENDLGNGVKDMFNTYDTGKNNNFKSVQDAITFLDAAEVDGKTTPDNTKKLEVNTKVAELAQQIRNGFYGDTGNELLTLNGKNLYSDVSIPNADGTKNSRLPLNMQSIKNAIAATDLSEADRNRMYEISQANTALYAKVESKEMTYAQYKDIKAASEQEYVSILSNSASYKKMLGLMDNLDKSGFFEKEGIGSTKSGQTYLWNALNAMLGSKGATPAANYPKTANGWGSGGGGNGLNATYKPGTRGISGIKWTPVQKRRMAAVKTGKYTPVDIKVKLGNEIKKDKSQNYISRSF